MDKEQAIKEVMGLVYAAMHKAVLYGTEDDGGKESAYIEMRDSEKEVESKLRELLDVAEHETLERVAKELRVTGNHADAAFVSSLKINV